MVRCRPAVDALKRTRGWVLFLGILTLLGSAFMAMIGVAVMLIGSLGSVLGGAEFPMPALFGVIYLVLAGLYRYPGVCLLRYAGAIKKIGGADPALAVEDALRQQQKFWRFAGLVAVAIIGLYGLIFLGAIGYQIFATARG